MIYTLTCKNLSKKESFINLESDLLIPNGPGAYMLANTFSGPIRYVGRSDTNLRSRLEDWKEKYNFYQFTSCSNAKEAFEKECQLWHEHGSTLDNKIHPDKPTGSGLACPICKK